MKRSNLKGKVVIITGSSQGIGKATALQLCKEGAHVVLNGRNPIKLENTQKEFLLKGLETLAIQGDITSISDCNKLIEETIKKYGKLDVLINNGSLTMNEKIDKIDPSIFREIIDSNSLGSVLPTLTALPHLKKSKGSVIFISSLAGLHGLPSASAYSMGKMALTAFWQSLKIELFHTGIHFGICYVSFTENEPDKRMITSDGSLIHVPKRPKFILQSREKVANTILYMIKKRKSRIVLSRLGNITAFIMRHLPKTVLSLIIFSQKGPKLHNATIH